MKKLIFKKGINKIRFPFLLSNFSPWQEQIAEETLKINARYLKRKNIEWGFEINEYGAEINVKKI